MSTFIRYSLILSAVAVMSCFFFSAPALAQNHGGHGGDSAMSAPAAYSDQAFLSAMIVHHEAAVEISRAVIQHGRDARVKKWAEAIIAAQEAEIKQMTEWLQTLGGQDTDAAAQMGEAMKAMTADPAGPDPDGDFLRLMIDHHAGAVEMAVPAILRSNDQRIIDLARKIIAVQVDEIILYRDWLNENRADQPPAGS